MMEVLNVDTGGVESNAESKEEFKTISQNKGITRDIIEQTLAYREESTSLDCLRVVRSIYN